MGRSTTTVLGIDPGSRRLGWAVVSGDLRSARRLASGTLRADARQSLPERLGQLLLGLQALFEQHPFDVLAIEAAFVHENPHTALALGQARGLPIALAAARGLPVHEYPPAVVKRTVVGSGRAEKTQMRWMVQRLLEMPELPQEDEADALAVALVHLRRAEATTAAAETLTPAQVAWQAALAAARTR